MSAKLFIILQYSRSSLPIEVDALVVVTLLLLLLLLQVSPAHLVVVSAAGTTMTVPFESLQTLHFKFVKFSRSSISTQTGQKSGPSNTPSSVQVKRVTGGP